MKLLREPSDEESAEIHALTDELLDVIETHKIAVCIGAIGVLAVKVFLAGVKNDMKLDAFESWVAYCRKQIEEHSR